jgi:hypothetical protein
MAAPLTADQLVAALRDEGCKVHEATGWRTNNRNHKGPWGPVNGVMVHHTVTGPETDVVSLIFNGHGALPGPLATGCITKDGTIHLTGNGRANHAGGGDPDVLTAVINESYGDYPPPTHEHDGSPGSVDGNARFYGWECENEGDGQDPWPRVQYVAMVKATAGICRAHGWSAKSTIGHLEWSDWKPDPRGFDMKTFRRDLAACLALPAGAWPDTQEDDVALTTDDINKVAKAVVDLLTGPRRADLVAAVFQTDGVLANPNPDTAADNPHVWAETILRNGEIIGRRTDVNVQAVKETLDSLSVGGVDLDALAAKVADLLAARLAE